MKVSSSRLEWVFLSIIVISRSSLLVRKLNRATGLGRLALMLSAEGFQVEANVSWPTKPCVRPIYLRSPRRGMCSPKTNFHRSPRMLLACFSPLLTISWTEHQKNRWCSFPWRTSSRRIMVGGPLRIWTEVVFILRSGIFWIFFWTPLRSCTAIHSDQCAKHCTWEPCEPREVRPNQVQMRDVFLFVAEWRPARPPLRIVPGDFIKTYQVCTHFFWIWLAIFQDFHQQKNTSKKKKAALSLHNLMEFTMEFTQQFNRKFWIQEFGCKLIIKSFVGKLKIPGKMLCLPRKTRFQHFVASCLETNSLPQLLGNSSRLAGRASVALMWRGRRWCFQGFFWKWQFCWHILY